VLNSDDNLWYRGTIQGRCDNQPSQIRVHLVDLDHDIVVDASNVRELSQKYIKVICMKMQLNLLHSLLPHVAPFKKNGTEFVNCR